MPKQVQTDTVAVHHEPGANSPGGDWLDHQQNFTSPTEGASQDAADKTLDLQHTQEKGLHKNGRSVAPNATSDAARPHPRPGVRDAEPAGFQQDYDNSGIDRAPETTKRSGKEKR